jgi:hypothetical protein
MASLSKKLAEPGNWLFLLADECTSGFPADLHVVRRGRVEGVAILADWKSGEKHGPWSETGTPAYRPGCPAIHLRQALTSFASPVDAASVFATPPAC